MKRKGLTLMELLAVIVILAIIVAIAIPSISGSIKNSNKEGFKLDAKMLLEQYEFKKLENESFEYSGISSLGLSDENYTFVDIRLVDGKPYILVAGKNRWNGLKACGTATNMNVVEVSNEKTCFVSDFITSKGVNKPKLANGMIPVKWITDHWVTTTESDADWYSYTTTDKEWANVIQVTDPSEYTISGTTVDVVNDVIAMWVWIPRYIYNISNGWHEQMTSMTAGTIEVKFSMDTDDTRVGSVTIINTGKASDSNNQWTSHPAFKFGDNQVTGIWVAKFEASGTTSAIDIKPNVESLRTTGIDDMFTAARNMETNTRYGWASSGSGIDTHMIKNVEWGAVAYLTQSTYGKNAKIFINPSDSYITGRGGDTVSQASTTDSSESASATLYGYDGKSCSSKTGYVCTGDSQGVYGMASSTTGNIYGIYDMAGGADEYVSAYVNNILSGNGLENTPEYGDIYDSGLDDSSQYHYDESSNCKGDALYETSEINSSQNWYNEYVYMPEMISFRFMRGGNNSEGSDAGIFNVDAFTGYGLDYISFRPVVLVDSEL